MEAKTHVDFLQEAREVLVQVRPDVAGVEGDGHDPFVRVAFRDLARDDYVAL